MNQKQKLNLNSYVKKPMSANKSRKTTEVVPCQPGSERVVAKRERATTRFEQRQGDTRFPNQHGEWRENELLYIESIINSLL